MNNKDKGIVYIIVYKDCIVYTGSTKDSLCERYLGNFSMTKMMQQFNDHIDSSELEFYIYKRKDFRKLEATFINYFCAKSIITCNIKCENTKQFYKMLNNYSG